MNARDAGQRESYRGVLENLISRGVLTREMGDINVTRSNINFSVLMAAAGRALNARDILNMAEQSIRDHLVTLQEQDQSAYLGLLGALFRNSALRLLFRQELARNAIGEISNGVIFNGAFVQNAAWIIQGIQGLNGEIRRELGRVDAERRRIANLNRRPGARERAEAPAVLPGAGDGLAFNPPQPAQNDQFLPINREAAAPRVLAANEHEPPGGLGGIELASLDLGMDPFGRPNDVMSDTPMFNLGNLRPQPQPQVQAPEAPALEQFNLEGLFEFGRDFIEGGLGDIIGGLIPEFQEIMTDAAAAFARALEDFGVNINGGLPPALFDGLGDAAVNLFNDVLQAVAQQNGAPAPVLDAEVFGELGNISLQMLNNFMQQAAEGVEITPANQQAFESAAVNALNGALAAIAQMNGDPAAQIMGPLEQQELAAVIGNLVQQLAAAVNGAEIFDLNQVQEIAGLAVDSIAGALAQANGITNPVIDPSDRQEFANQLAEVLSAVAGAAAQFSGRPELSLPGAEQPAAADFALQGITSLFSGDF